jgi:hypothetical protein
VIAEEILKRRCFQFKTGREENVRWLLFPGANKSWLRLRGGCVQLYERGNLERLVRALKMFLRPSGFESRYDLDGAINAPHTAGKVHFKRSEPLHAHQSEACSLRRALKWRENH